MIPSSTIDVTSPFETKIRKRAIGMSIRKTMNGHLSIREGSDSAFSEQVFTLSFALLRFFSSEQRVLVFSIYFLIMPSCLSALTLSCPTLSSCLSTLAPQYLQVIMNWSSR